MGIGSSCLLSHHTLPPACCWVCGTYVVHHFNGTEVRCAPLTCGVHQKLQSNRFTQTVDGAQCDDVSLAAPLRASYYLYVLV